MKVLKLFCLLLFFCNDLQAQGSVNCENFDNSGIKITLREFDSLVIKYNYLSKKDTSLLGYEDFITIIKIANTLEAYKVFDDCGKMSKKQPFYEEFLILYATILYDKSFIVLKKKYYLRYGRMMCETFYKGKYATKIDSVARYIPSRNPNRLYMTVNFLYVFGAFAPLEDSCMYQITDVNKKK
jgi:hypothetical protein